MNYDLSRFLLFFCLGCCLSCTDEGVIDDEEEVIDSTVKTEINKWVFDRMKNYYLWYDELPAENTLQYEQEPKTFFNSLLTDKDGKNGSHYSRIEYDDSILRSSKKDVSYGFEYRLIRIADKNEFLAQALYVFKDSPADKAGLKRGELIITVDGKALTASNYSDLLDTPKSGAEMQLGKMVSETHFDKSRTIQMGRPEEAEDNSVYLDTVIPIQNHKIAYLVYNSFEDEYDDNLRMAFRKFKKAEADEFVLDLRYNRGGSISSSQLLATMLVPEAYMGKEFIHLKYNKLINRQDNLLFDKSVIGRGANINPQRLYIITSESTASASEAIINGLRPYMNSNLIQVGETTFGKNVGQALFTNEKWQSLEVWPTSFNLFNSEDFGDYEKGLPADVEYSEGLQLGEFASKEDPLFSIVLSIIEGKDLSKNSLRSSNKNFEIIYNSLSRKQPLGYYK